MQDTTPVLGSVVAKTKGFMHTTRSLPAETSHSPVGDLVVAHAHGCVHTKAYMFVFVHTLVHQGLNPGLLHTLNMQSTMRAILPEIFLVLHYNTILNVNTIPGTALTGW